MEDYNFLLWQIVLHACFLDMLYLTKSQNVLHLKTKKFDQQNENSYALRLGVICLISSVASDIKNSLKTKKNSFKYTLKYTIVQWSVYLS